MATKLERETLRTGTTLYATYKGEAHTLKVVKDGEDGKSIGYQVDGHANQTYASLSTAAKAITGTAVNGHVFWKDAPKTKAEKVAKAPKAAKVKADKPAKVAKAAKVSPAPKPTKKSKKNKGEVMQDDSALTDAEIAKLSPEERAEYLKK